MRARVCVQADENVLFIFKWTSFTIARTAVRTAPIRRFVGFGFSQGVSSVSGPRLVQIEPETLIHEDPVIEDPRGSRGGREDTPVRTSVHGRRASGWERVEER